MLIYAINRVRKMRKEIVLFLVTISVLGLIACEGENPTGTGQATYIQGDLGLIPSFQENAPPAEVFDMGQDPFDVTVVLTNKGYPEIPKESFKITLNGLNPPDFGKTESDFIINSISTKIESSYIDAAGNTYWAVPVEATFPNLNFKGTLTVDKEFPIWIDVCYNYYTLAESEGCIKKDIRSTEGVCIVAEEKDVLNSAAPIKVTKFEEVAGGTDTVKYFFTITHIGQGRIFAPDTKCALDRSNLNRVFFKIESKVADLQCTGFTNGESGKEGIILLRDNVASVRCSQQKNSEIDYPDPIEITLDYDYEQTIKQNIMIKRGT